MHYIIEIIIKLIKQFGRSFILKFKYNFALFEYFQFS